MSKTQDLKILLQKTSKIENRFHTQLLNTIKIILKEN